MEIWWAMDPSSSSGPGILQSGPRAPQIQSSDDKTFFFIKLFWFLGPAQPSRDAASPWSPL